MQRQVGILSLIPYVFILVILGSCANRKAFNKRQFLPGRNINLSNKFRSTKDLKVKKDDRIFVQTSDSLIQTFPKCEIAEVEFIPTKFVELKKIHSAILDEVLTKRTSKNYFVPNRTRLKRSSFSIDPTVVSRKIKVFDKERIRTILITSLFYLLGLTALAAAIFLIIANSPEALILLAGGIGLVLLYLGWNYWRKYGKTYERKPAEVEALKEKKSSGNSISSETVLTILLVISGIGMLVYFLFYY